MDFLQFSGPSTGFGLSVVPGIFLFFPKHSHSVSLWFSGSQTHVHVVVSYISSVLSIRKNLLG